MNTPTTEAEARALLAAALRDNNRGLSSQAIADKYNAPIAGHEVGQVFTADRIEEFLDERGDLLSNQEYHAFTLVDRQLSLRQSAARLGALRCAHLLG
jgi:hypothetical protein